MTLQKIVYKDFQINNVKFVRRIIPWLINNVF